ncbi:tRNA lysidine(34) synthetase TilS [Robbsia andropogonis]|uniref:tRNA lysidine(34) synthetase TilS n=1 Tax=Robbsia andropogonis TaxID=28092 RepID=UPI0009E32F91|nr:tRNA lysidine(34) synthetase TilS [Robbsia andropogonis]
MASSRKTVPTDVDCTLSVWAAVRDALSAPLPDLADESEACADAVAPTLSGAVHPRVGIAFSGGLDSSVLLDASVQVLGASRCVAFHVHHGLQAVADDWVAHCAAACATLGVAFIALRVAVPSDGGEGIEAAARQARYRALRAAAAANDIDTMLLGHHADDQAETVLLQLLRGAGLPGLAAMPMMRDDVPTSIDKPLAALRWYRPLLCVTRETLAAYASRRGVRWVDDASNDDNRFTRNALRHDVMPVIAAHFPAYRTTLARVARHAAASQQLMTVLAEDDWAQCRLPDDDGLSLSALRTMSLPRIENLLRHWTRCQGLPAPSAARLAEMVAQTVGKGVVPGQRACIAHAGHCLQIYRGRVHWVAMRPNAPRVLRADSPGKIVMDGLRYAGESRWSPPGWPGCFYFSREGTGDVSHPNGLARVGSAASTDASTDEDMTKAIASDPVARLAWVVPLAALMGRHLAARPRMGGERMRLGARRPQRTLKQLYQGAGVPVWQRDAPLLYVDGQLCFVPYVGGYLPEVVELDGPTVTVWWADTAD